jgi:hypothetical protein
MTTVSQVIGDITLWAHAPASYNALTDAFLAGAGGVSLERLCGLSTQTPVVLAIITEDDPDHVTIVHSPHRYPALGHHYDDQYFAFLGNDLDNTMALRLRIPASTDLVGLRTVGLATHAAAYTTVGGPLFRPRINPAAAVVAGHADIETTRVLVMPTRFAREAIARGRFNLDEFYDTFIQPYQAEPGFLAGHTVLTNWWIAATTDRAAFGDVAQNRSLLQLDVSDDGNYAARRTLLQWARRIVQGVLDRMPGAGPPVDPLTGTQFTTAITQLRERIQAEAELSRDEIAAQRTADRQAPSFADRFGAASGEALVNLLGVASVDDLPDVFIRLGANKKNRDTDRNVIEGILTQRSRSVNSPADSLTAPAVTPSLLTLFREQRFTSATPTLGEGLSPFNVACLGHPSSRQAAENAAQLARLESGSTALSASDVNRLSKNLLALPMNEYLAYDQLVGYTVLVDVIFGEGHLLATRLRNAVHTARPYLTTNLLSLRGEAHARRKFAISALYWIHTYVADYIDARLSGDATVELPPFSSWLGYVKRGEVNQFPTLPSSWDALLAPPNPPAVAAGTPAPARAPGGGSSPGGGGAPRADRGAKVINPRANNALRDRWGNSGLTNVAQLLAKCTDDTKKPKFGEEDACLTWLLRGSCLENCARKSTHKAAPEAVIKQTHELLTHCGVPTN